MGAGAWELGRTWEEFERLGRSPDLREVEEVRTTAGEAGAAADDMAKMCWCRRYTQCREQTWACEDLAHWA